MMRTLAIGFALVALAGCSPQLTGAHCTTNDNCPRDQHCEQGVCKEGGTTGTVVTCPAAGTAVGQGCSAEGAAARTCDASNRQLQVCAADANQCLVWKVQDDCGSAGLVCNTSNGQFGCICPPYDAGAPATFWVFGSGTDAGVVNVVNGQNGGPLPSCSYSRLEPALTAARAAFPSDGGSVTIAFQGNDLPPGWMAKHGYRVGDEVTPSSLNGHAYRATRDAGSGDTEPAWPTTNGGTVQDGDQTWLESRTVAPAVIPHGVIEKLPPNLVVANNGCIGGPGVCDARGYVLMYEGNGANGAIELSNNDSIQGLTFSSRATSGDLLHCSDDAGAAVDLEHLGLDGAGGAAHGLVVTRTCSVSATDVVARGFTASAVQVKTATGASPSTLTTGVLSDSAIGAEIESGDLTLSGVELSRNSVAGGLVDGSALGATDPALNFSFDGGTITRNRGPGLVLRGVAKGGLGSNCVTAINKPTYSINYADISRNNRAALPDAGGIAIDRCGTLAPMREVNMHDNGFAQIYFGTLASPGDLDPNEGTLQYAWRLTSSGLNLRLYCYLPLGATGIWSDITSAPNQHFIDAEYLGWDYQKDPTGDDTSITFDGGSWYNANGPQYGVDTKHNLLDPTSEDCDLPDGGHGTLWP